MGEMKNNESLLILTILLSISLHLLLGVGMQHFGKSSLFPTTQEIELIYNESSRKKNSKQVISEIEQLEEQVNRLKSAVNRLSKNKVRVKEETVARFSGDKTVNRGQANPSQLSRTKQRKTVDKKPSQDLYKRIVETQPQIQPQQISGFSTSSDYIPNVKLGTATALNADQFTYYTFFERIKQQLRPRWVNRIRASVAKFPPNKLRQLGRVQQYTEIEVILDRKGYLKDIVVVRESESSELDEAATESFASIAPLLNPPNGMVGKDGLIRIYYSFNVQLAPRPFVRNGR